MLLSHRVLPGRVARALFVLTAVVSLALVGRATIGTSLQMQLGNPTSATTDPTSHTHYLIQRPQYAMDYNDTTHEPNWVSWDLTSDDVGSSGRSNFTVDTTLPVGYYQVLTTDYSGSGYDRGHLCPSADRTVTVADNQQVFYMSNMMPQTPDNNQGVWNNFESYCRSLASAGNELLIITGPSLFSGSTIASGVAIPGYTWKIVVVVPLGAGTAISRITPTTRVIAIRVPNIAGVRSTPWQNFVTSVSQIETDTGFTFFDQLPPATAAALKGVVDGQTQNGFPTISSQPVGLSTAVGGTATFSVTATSTTDTSFTYQWLKDSNEITGATKSSLALTNVQAADAGTYTVTVANSVGTVTSSDAVLVITGVPVSIQTPPTSRTVLAGSSVSFTVTAAGSPSFSYQWRKGGTNLSNGGNVSGVTTPTLTLSNVQSADIGSYDVVVTNDVNSATSSAAALTVTASAPVIASQPANESLAPGSVVTFTVVATGTSPMTYQWRKGGSNLSDGGIISGSSTATLTLNGISAGDVGNYDVVVTNSVNSTTSNTAALTIVNATATQVFYTGGTYTQNFDSLPNTGTFTFSGAGAFYLASAVDTVTNKGGVGAANLGGWSFGKIAGTGTAATFRVGTGSDNAGAAYSFGSTGSTDRALGALLSGSVESTWGVTLVNNTGQTINQFTVAYTGEQWRYGAGTLGGTDKISAEYLVGATDILTGTFTAIPALDFSSPVNSSVAVGTAAAKDGNATANRGTVTATVTNANWGAGQTLVIRWRDFNVGGSDDGLAVDDFSLTTAITGPVGPSVVSTTPANNATGAALNATVAVTFDQPVSATGAAFLLSSAKRGAISASLSASTDKTTYTLTPPVNFDYSDTVTVKVLAAGVTSISTGLHPTADTTASFTTTSPIAPGIVTQPQSQTAPAATTASFTVVASGSAPFSYTWRKNGTPITGNVTASTATLVLSNVQAADAADYDVIVANGVNPPATSTAATLTVTPVAPTITTQPVSRDVDAGTTVIFTAAVTGSTPMTYQWQLNGVNLSDSGNVSGSATATLTITSATVANSGTYTLVINNGVGSAVTSNSATLNVTPLPVPFTGGNIVLVRVGSGTGSLVNTGNAVYLDEYTPDGTRVQTIKLPTAASGANQPFIIGGTGTSEGALSRSTDGRYLALTGYAAAPGGSTSLSGTTSAAVNRVVARVDSAGLVDTSTALTDFASGTNPRSAVTVDGSSFWVAGAAGGVRYASFGATTSTSISTNIGNVRTLGISGAQLYLGTASGSTRIASVGTGLPTDTGAVATQLPGFPATGSPYGFFFADLDPTVPGDDTLYVTDDTPTTGAIQKYSLVAGSWVLNGTVTASATRGITGVVANGVVTIYATTGTSTGTGGGSLYKFVDTTGYNGAVSGTATTLATAAANTTFRGVALAPGLPPTITTPPSGSTATVGDTVTLSVAVSGTNPMTFQWRKGGIALSDAGVISGSSTASLKLTGVTTVNAGSYDVIVSNAFGSQTSSAATLTINKATAPVTLGGLTPTYDGTAKAATVTTSPTGLTVNVTYNGSATVPTAAGSYPVVATVNDANYAGTASGTLVIAPAQATVTLGGLSTAFSGQPRPVTVTTTPSGLSYTVTYAGSATAPSAAGSYPVVATVTNPNYTGSATGTLVIGRGTQWLTIGALPAVINVGVPFTISATSSAGITPITFLVLSGNARVVGTTVTVSDTNPVTIRASQTGTDNYAPASADVTFSATKQAQTITFAALPDVKTDAKPITLSATASSGLPVTLSLVSGPASLSGNTLTLAGTAGTVSVRASQPGDATFAAAADVTQSFAVTSLDVAPAIATQPASAAAKVGTSVSFSVVATGSPAPTYQWRKTGTAISGATNATYTVASVQAADAGVYDVVVTNRVSSVTSSAARLTVTTADVAPTIVVAPHNVTVLAGRSTTLAVVATGVPAPTYRWTKNGATISGATSATYTIASATVADAGSYAAVVSNSAGSVTSAAATVRVIARSFAGSYFGTIGSIGFFAIQINDDNTGVFLGYLTNSSTPFVSLTLTVDDNGAFHLGTTITTSGSVAGDRPVAAAATDFAFDGTISSSGVLSGTVSGGATAALAATRASDNGGTANVAGFYQASVSGTSAATYTIVSPAGQAMVLTQTSAGADAGTGTVDSTGRVTVKTAANQTVAATITAASGTIAAQVTSASGQVTTYTGASAAVTAAQRFVNVSTRASVGTAGSVTIAGIIIAGQDPKPVLLRAVGPGLTSFGVSGVLAKPRLELYSGTTLVATNTGWSTATNADDIAAAATQSGAFALTSGSADSAIATTVAPGAYTLVVSGADGGTGIALVEAYDLSTPALGQKMINISTRAQVSGGTSNCIAGFVVSGSVPKRVLIRGVGPSLTTYGVTGQLTKPQLTVFRGSTVIAQNAGWSSSADATAITNAGKQVGAFAFTSNDDAAVLISLEPGAYTAQLSGVGSATGVGLVEVYEVP